MKSIPITEIPQGMPLGGVTWGQLEAALVEAMKKVHRESRQEEKNDAAAWTASQIAKETRRRPATVLEALKSGALPGHRRGNRWCASVANVRAWVESGCPVAILARSA